jgi:hypothetical protein
MNGRQLVAGEAGAQQLKVQMRPDAAHSLHATRSTTRSDSVSTQVADTELLGGGYRSG